MHVRLRRAPRFTGSAHYLFYSDKFIFNEPGSLVAEWEEEDKWIRMPFRKSGKTLFSLSGSSFGGPDHSGVTVKELTTFIRQLVDHPEFRDVERMQVRSFPACYAPDTWETQHEALLSARFEPVITDINMHLELSVSSFRKVLHRAEFRYLNKAAEANWEFRRLDFTQYLTEAYTLFVAARALKAYPVTMKQDDFTRMFKEFPEEYLLFGVFDGDRMIAASVCIRLNEKILYDFFHGDLPEYRKHSPVVFLINGLFDYAQRENMKLLDLGTCSENGVPNPDLCVFKRMLGGQESAKITYSRKL